MTEQRTELPKELQLDNYIMALASFLAPLWWVSVLVYDARDKAKGEWRRPTLPKVLRFNVPPGVSFGDANDYLNQLGIQTAIVGGQWYLQAGIVMLDITVLVPGRLHSWAQYCVDRLLSGDPVQRRWSRGVTGGNLEMLLSDWVCRITGRHSKLRGKTLAQAKRQLKGPSVAKRLAGWLED